MERWGYNALKRREMEQRGNRAKKSRLEQGQGLDQTLKISPPLTVGEKVQILKAGLNTNQPG